MSDSCRFHGPFMALSWRFLPSDFYCFSKQFHGTCMSDSWQIHRGFIADSCQFLSVPKKQNHVRFMSLSWQFHGTFTYEPYLGTVCQNLLEKVIQKGGVGCRFVFCLISASFLAICQIHVGFMALSWRFLPSDFYCFSKQFHGTCMSDSWQIHRGFIADSCQFLSVPKKQNHVRFMSLSWHFHIRALPGYSLPKSIGKSYPKSRCWLSIWFFCLITASFLAICQIHVGFMALSWHFHGAFFLLIFIVIFWEKSKPTTESISKMTV